MPCRAVLCCAVRFELGCEQLLLHLCCPHFATVIKRSCVLQAATAIQASRRQAAGLRRGAGAAAAAGSGGAAAHPGCTVYGLRHPLLPSDLLRSVLLLQCYVILRATLLTLKARGLLTGVLCCPGSLEHSFSAPHWAVDGSAVYPWLSAAQLLGVTLVTSCCLYSHKVPCHTLHGHKMQCHTLHCHKMYCHIVQYGSCE